MKLQKKIDRLFFSVKSFFQNAVRIPRVFKSEQDAFRGKLKQLFQLRDKHFFNKKKPTSAAYPFTLIDPYDIWGEDGVLHALDFVGDEWKNKDSQKPIAILWGFNNWKWGFASDYLPDYRTAFASKKIPSIAALLALKRFPRPVDAFFFWGYTEPSVVRWYAKRMGIKIFRMEDGFIRSSMLGASHSVPYSLVVDSQGLYYNPQEPSDIETILENYEFSESDIESAKRCMSLMKELRLSKYNAPELKPSKHIIKTKRRVAILGQVDNDMSIRMGNIDRWSMVEIISLAKYENPDSEIIYRPHPEVYQGYQDSHFKRKKVEEICQISSPEIPIIDFLESVDQVYVVTSLSGLEALLLGKKVTVMGAAFYSGWGLTDDRVSIPRRKKSRTLEELFSAIYLKYPRYLSNSGDAEVDFFTVCLRINADREINAFNEAKKLDGDGMRSLIAQTEYWPRALLSGSVKRDVCDIAINDLSGVVSYLQKFPGRTFQIYYVYALSGALKDNNERDKLLISIRRFVDIDIFNDLLLDLAKVYPGEYLAKHFSWLLGEVGEIKASIDFLEKDWRSISSRISKSGSGENAESNGEDVSQNSVGNNVITNNHAELTHAIFLNCIHLRKFDEAIHHGKILLLSNYYMDSMLYRFTQIADFKFDLASVIGLAKLGGKANLYGSNRAMVQMEIKNFSEENVRDNPVEFIAALIRFVTLKYDKINIAFFTAKKFSSYINSEFIEKVLRSSLSLDNDLSVRKALGYISIGKPEKAISVLETLIKNENTADNVCIAYSQALSFAGRIDEAIAFTNSALKSNKTSAFYREMLRLLVLVGGYEQSLKTLREAQSLKIELGDMHPRKSYFGGRMIKEAFETFQAIPISTSIAKSYPEKYKKPFFEVGKKLLLLSVYGPGDEIRFASIYNKLTELFPDTQLIVSCEPRLFSLFSRSFNSIKFIKVPRPRVTELIDINDYSRVPGSDLITTINNTAHDAIQECDQMCMVSDMLSTCLPDYESFTGKKYLICDSLLVEKYREQLPKGKTLVGLSWRSSLNTHSRNEHYLAIEELESLFSIENIQFVNFQYDDCQAELDWVEARYPGKLVDLKNIDHYNDFESVAALMECVDLMIAPATTVVELAGALGRPTWLLSNSSELHWRKVDSHGTDVWHSSITHIEGDVLGDKSSIVTNLYSKLSDFVSDKKCISA